MIVRKKRKTNRMVGGRLNDMTGSGKKWRQAKTFGRRTKGGIAAVVLAPVKAIGAINTARRLATKAISRRWQASKNETLSRKLSKELGYDPTKYTSNRSKQQRKLSKYELQLLNSTISEKKRKKVINKLTRSQMAITNINTNAETKHAKNLATLRDLNEHKTKTTSELMNVLRQQTMKNYNTEKLAEAKSAKTSLGQRFLRGATFDLFGKRTLGNINRNITNKKDKDAQKNYNTPIRVFTEKQTALLALQKQKDEDEKDYIRSVRQLTNKAEIETEKKIFDNKRKLTNANIVKLEKEIKVAKKQYKGAVKDKQQLNAKILKLEQERRLALPKTANYYITQLEKSKEKVRQSEQSLSNAKKEVGKDWSKFGSNIEKGNVWSMTKSAANSARRGIVAPLTLTKNLVVSGTKKTAKVFGNIGKGFYDIAKMPFSSIFAKYKQSDWFGSAKKIDEAFNNLKSELEPIQRTITNTETNINKNDEEIRKEKTKLIDAENAIKALEPQVIAIKELKEKPENIEIINKYKTMIEESRTNSDTIANYNNYQTELKKLQTNYDNSRKTHIETIKKANEVINTKQEANLTLRHDIKDLIPQRNNLAERMNYFVVGLKKRIPPIESIEPFAEQFKDKYITIDSLDNITVKLDAKNAVNSRLTELKNKRDVLNTKLTHEEKVEYLGLKYLSKYIENTSQMKGYENTLKEYTNYIDINYKTDRLNPNPNPNPNPSSV